MTLTDTAEAVATRAHAGQVDKAGQDYIAHPRRVAQRAAYIAPEEIRQAAVATAWLHDTVEDTGMSLQDLREAGMPEDVIEAVDLLTKKDGLGQEDYFAAIRNNPIARIVKVCDLADNTDPVRTAELGADQRARLSTKYARSWALLLG